MKIREQGAPNFKYLRMLLDSGNSVDNLISLDYYKKLCPQGEIVTVDQEATTANNQKLPILGRTKIPLEIDFFSPDPNETRHVKWHVSPLVVDGLVNDFLMSLAALAEIDGSLRASKKTFTLHMEDNEPPLVIPIGRRDIKVSTRKRVIIPPHHEKHIHLVVPGGLNGEEFLIEADEELGDKMGVFSRHSVDRVRPGEIVHMRVWNVNDHPVTIPRGTEWAVGNPFSEVPNEDCVAALAVNVNRIAQKVRETGTGAEQLIKEHWPRNQKEMYQRLWKELNFDSEEVQLSREEKWALVMTFAAVPKALALGPYDVGFVEGVELSIDTGDHPPIADKCRPMSQERLEALKAQIKRWIGQGVAEWTDGPWASATVVVKKTNGGLRFCADYRALNQITVKDARPVAHMGEKLARLKNDHEVEPKYFASIDLSDAYYCVPVKEEDRDKTAMISPLGLLRFNRMSFGLRNAPAMWNQVVQMIEKKIMEKNPDVGNALLMYFDDAVLSGVTFEDLREKLQAFLEVIAEVGCKVQPRKCTLGQRLKWLGHVFDKDGIYPNTDYIQTMKDWDAPVNNKELATMTGKLEWVDKFVPNMKQKTHAIWELKARSPVWRKNTKPVPIDWFEDSNCEAEWNAIMEELTSPPVLAHPDWSPNRAPFIIAVDTSSKGIGCILSQDQWVTDPETGERTKKERVLSFASKRLKDAERNYSAYKLELFGLLTAVQHFHYFLIDKPFIVRSDHKALKWLTQTVNKKLPCPLSRWQETLMTDYEFEFQWVPGTHMKGPDALSRKKYRPGDNGNMADIKLRDDPIWANCDVDPQEAATREDDDFWIPVFASRKRKSEEPSIVGAITRSKRRRFTDESGRFINESGRFTDESHVRNPEVDAPMDTDMVPDDEDLPEEDLVSRGEGPPLAQFETPEESWADLIDGLPQFEDEDEEDAEVKIRPKAAWWWHEFLRHTQDCDIALSYLKGHVEQSKPWPRSNKEINSLVKKVFQDAQATDEEEDAFKKMLWEQRRGAKFQVHHEEEDDPGILTIQLKNHGYELFVIPFKKWEEHVQLVHHDLGTFHRGCDQTLTKMEETFWFPAMKPFVQSYINRCRQCQDGKRLGNRYGANLGQTSSNPKPRLKNWAVDIVEMPKGKYGMKYLLTMLDISTKWIESWPLTNFSTHKIVKIIEEDIIPRYGEDLTFIFDHGSNFKSKLMLKVLNQKGCKRYFGTTYHPNSLPVERYHRTLVSLIRLLLLDREMSKEMWPEVLPLALYAMRCSPDSDSKTSAYERTFGFPPATQISSWTGTRPRGRRIPEDVEMRAETNRTPGMYPSESQGFIDESGRNHRSQRFINESGNESQGFTDESMEPEPNVEVMDDGETIIVEDRTGSRRLSKVAGKRNNYYAAVNALAWSQEYAQTMKDQAANRRHDYNADRFNRGFKVYRPLINEFVDWHMTRDPDSLDSRKLANYWKGIYAVTAVRQHGQTVQIQKVEVNSDGKFQTLPETSREAYVGDLRPTLMLSFQSRPHGNWDPSWIRK